MGEVLSVPPVLSCARVLLRSVRALQHGERQCSERAAGHATSGSRLRDPPPDAALLRRVRTPQRSAYTLGSSCASRGWCSRETTSCSPATARTSRCRRVGGPPRSLIPQLRRFGTEKNRKLTWHDGFYSPRNSCTTFKDGTALRPRRRRHRRRPWRSDCTRRAADGGWQRRAWGELRWPPQWGRDHATVDQVP